jgi:hypothetical protein
MYELYIKLIVIEYYKCIFIKKIIKNYLFFLDIALYQLTNEFLD